MLQVVVDGDIEQIMCDWLPAQLAAHGFSGVAVSTKARTTEGVSVFRTGGVRQTLVSDQPQVTFDCRAATETRASAMAAMVRGLVHALNGDILAGHQIYSAGDVGGPVNLPDPDYQGARYRWNAQIHLRSTVL